jgi:hypothetical protein
VRNKNLSDREKRRLATRRERNGDDFDSRNARHAGRHTHTKFNSATGRDAAKLRWTKYREDKLKKLHESEQQNG